MWRFARGIAESASLCSLHVSGLVQRYPPGTVLANPSMKSCSNTGWVHKSQTSRRTFVGEAVIGSLRGVVLEPAKGTGVTAAVMASRSGVVPKEAESHCRLLAAAFSLRAASSLQAAASISRCCLFASASSFGVRQHPFRAAVSLRRPLPCARRHPFCAAVSSRRLLPCVRQ